MEWFEPIIIVAAVGFVITVFYFRFFHKKKGKKKGGCCCYCSKSTIGKCTSCKDCQQLINEYKKEEQGL